ncbi:tetratricopeptide repeat protein [Persicimonas caeni]|uniref:Tetratricopeptide repeat protein n=1 Tax=Persicimonas caeni TaxID=2292766 RepID=A0A4Y6PWH0_PERCE|nr:serine/threonine-protein kinase [Persicimonas caeni]QDG52682.1 tetratricopeptide repeat protein [Persicimonas caeni]QED33904.1 tetratricopeptide repeat protein [Persicimonas caeni]
MYRVVAAVTSNSPHYRPAEPIGQLGPFDLLEFLGEGAMGQVWRARHREQGVDAAIKVVTEEQALREEYGRQFRQEVRAVAGLSHPGVVMVFDHGEVTPEVEDATLGELRAHSPYLAMELCPRGSLADVERQLSFASIRSILLALLDALAHAHARGVIHRDIKPGNILLADEPDWGRVKLTDFGLAFVAERFEDAVLRGACGTPSFMSPEQFRGHWRDVGPWTDLYAIGCLAYYLVCGKPVYRAFPTVSVAKKHLHAPIPPLEPRIAVPEAFEGWVRRLLHKDPLERYRNAADASGPLQEMRPLPEMSPLQSTGTQKATRPRRASKPERSFQLLGAGLGLYGLRHVPLVGRQEERDALWTTLCEAVETHSPRAALIRGPSGVGKSFLAQWLCERAEELGLALNLRATHSPSPGGGEGLPKMLARHFRAAGLERAALVERLRGWFRARGVDDAYEWDALAEIISPATEADLERGQRKIQFARPEQRYALIARVLGLIARERAVIVWLDDLQWSSDSLSLLRYCLDSDACADVPLVLVGTIRSEALVDQSTAMHLVAEFALHKAITHVGLGPLPSHEQARFIETLLHLAPALARQVADRTRGNPLFAVQLVGDWVDRGVLEVGEAGFVLADGEEAPVPDDVFEVWSSRLERALSQADEETMYALELAAVLGLEVNEAEWRASLRLTGTGFPEAQIQRLLSHRLLDETDTGVRFAHSMLRESLERRAKEAGRYVGHHRVCARMLQERYGGEKQAAERLGRHLLAARAYLDALDPLLVGARARGNASDFEATLVLLDLREGAIEALGLPTVCAPRIENWALRAICMAFLHDYEAAYALARRALNSAEKLDDPRLTATCCYRLSQCVQFQGDYGRALPLLQRAQALAADFDDDDLAMRLASGMGQALTRLGRPDEAVEHLEKARALATALDDTLHLPAVLDALGSCERHRGRLAEAEAVFREALAHCNETGHYLVLSMLMNSLGDVVRLQGRLAEAEQIYRKVVAGEDTHHQRGVSTALLNLALIYVQTDRFKQAKPILDDLAPGFERQQHARFLLYTRAISLPCLAAEADWYTFERRLGLVLEGIGATGLVDVDLAICLEKAGQLAADARHNDYATRLFDAAAQQRLNAQGA